MVNCILKAELEQRLNGN